MAVNELVLGDKSGGCGQSYLLIVISEAFTNVKKLLHRQTALDLGQTLALEIANLHALELEIWTCEQWEGKEAQYGR